MTRFLAGACAALIMLSAGLYLWVGNAQEKSLIPDAPPPPEPVAQGLPINIPADAPKFGPAPPTPPVARPETLEARRFGRYDKNRDDNISRAELLGSRSKAFRKLDKDGNNLLTFEEWAVATSNRFAKADANGDLKLDRPEFASTRPKRKVKQRCKC